MNSNLNIYQNLNQIRQKPKLYEFYTAHFLWDDNYISQKMLEAHLDQTNDIASRNKDFFDQSVQFMIKKFNINSNTTICDFGCGPGLYATEFVKLGAKVTGIDFSKRSIDFAQNKAKNQKLNINYIYQNYLDYDTDERFDLILLIQRDYTALNFTQRTLLLQKFKRLLNPNGFIVIDVFTENIFRSIQEHFSINYHEGNKTKDYWSNFWSNKPHYVFNSVYRYEDEHVSLNKHTIFEKERSFEIFNWTKYFSLTTLREEVSSEGLEIFEQYSNICGDKFKKDNDELAIILKSKITQHA